MSHILPISLLDNISSEYPGIWKNIDKYREQVKVRYPWPNNVFIHSYFGTGIVEIKHGSLENRHYEAFLIHALASWRVTKGIYTFDPTLQEELLKTTLSDNINTNVFNYLPEYSVYVDTEEPFFATLDFIDSPVLNLIYPNNQSVYQIPLVESINLMDQIKEMYDEKMVSLYDKLEESILQEAQEQHKFYDRMIKRISDSLHFLLYLCSDEPDINKPFSKPIVTKTKKGKRIFQSKTVKKVDVGIRVGRFIKEQREQYKSSGTGIGSSKMPHYRKAHWHTFRIGKNRENRIVKWIAPILVGGKGAKPVIKKVK